MTHEEYFPECCYGVNEFPKVLTMHGNKRFLKAEKDADRNVTMTGIQIP